LTASRLAFWASQIATNWTSGSGSIQRRSCWPRLRMPIPPTIMRSLGGTAPLRPNTEAGTIYGTAARVAVRLRNARRDRLDFFCDMMVSS
jgi:hypothetical protein